MPLIGESPALMVRGPTVLSPPEDISTGRARPLHPGRGRVHEVPVGGDVVQDGLRYSAGSLSSRSGSIGVRDSRVEEYTNRHLRHRGWWAQDIALGNSMDEHRDPGRVRDIQSLV